MRAIVQHQYGGADNLQVADVPQPTPADDEVLIEVHASSINHGDWLLKTIAGSHGKKGLTIRA